MLRSVEAARASISLTVRGATGGRPRRREGITHTKLRQFASEAAALEVSELLDISRPGKRHTLLLNLLRQARMRCRDELIEMLLRRIRRPARAFPPSRLRRPA